VKVKRTPRDLYRVPNEQTPLFPDRTGVDVGLDGSQPAKTVSVSGYNASEDVESGDSIVITAIYINLVANTILLVSKICVTVLTNSLSILASLVDGALDFLSTAIVWTTTRMISRPNSYAYPVGRRRLEPIGVLVFSIIMVTAFFQVMFESFKRIISDNHVVVELTLPVIVTMVGTIVIKFIVWLWCRSVKNSSVQALAQDAITDVVFNIFSIIFPIGKTTTCALIFLRIS
jgi:divalent metal cation (Fe/Co/Zn/Cd) transporter